MNQKPLTQTRIRPDRFLKPVRSVLTTSLILLTLTACGNNGLRIAGSATIPNNIPILQIDPGGHKSKIKDVTFTKDGRYLVSAGDDKVVRVWDLKTGKTVRTLRGQVGAGYKDDIDVMALSPDEQWLAVGGYMQIPGESEFHIRLYNFSTGDKKLINAIIHRNYFGPPIQISIYDDKKMIWNIGDLIKHASYPRNPRLADVFFKGGLIVLV